MGRLFLVFDCQEGIHNFFSDSYDASSQASFAWKGVRQYAVHNMVYLRSHMKNSSAIPVNQTRLAKSGGALFNS